MHSEIADPQCPSKRLPSHSIEAVLTLCMRPSIVREPPISIRGLYPEALFPQVNVKVRLSALVSRISFRLRTTPVTHRSAPILWSTHEPQCRYRHFHGALRPRTDQTFAARPSGRKFLRASLSLWRLVRDNTGADASV